MFFRARSKWQRETSATGGIEYFNTETLKDIKVIGEVREISSHHAAIFELPVKVGEVELNLIYSLNTHGPALSVAARFSNQQDVIVRNLVMYLEIKNVHEKSILNVPGNGLRSNLAVSTLTESAGISPLGGLRGSLRRYICQIP